MGIPQAAYSQMEAAKKNRKATLQKIAEAMNIDYLQLKIQREDAGIDFMLYQTCSKTEVSKQAYYTERSFV